SSAVVKTFWGRYYEGAASDFYTAATPGIHDYTHQDVDAAGNPIGPVQVIIPAQVYGISNDISHPRTDEFNVSYEQQLFHNLRFTASGIWRWGGDFLNNVITGARWSPKTVTNGLTGQPYTAYSWANQ